MNKQAYALRKIGALKEEVKLKPYQQRVVDKIKDKNSLVVAHGTGTGKTVSSVAAAEELGAKPLVVTPASLRDNYALEGVKKFTDRDYETITSSNDEVGDADYRIVSGSLFSKDPDRYTEGRDTLIMDEAHNMRNQDTNLYKAVRDNKDKFKNRILLTASPFNNSPGDLASLLNTVKGEDEYSQNEINKNYVKPIKKKTGPLSFLGIGREDTVGEKFEPDANLKLDLHEYFDFEGGQEDLPEVEEEVVEVPMTDKQFKAYRYAYNQLPRAIRRAVKKDIVPDKQEHSGFFGAIANARVASNNPDRFLDKQSEYSSAKLNKILEDLDTDKEYGSMVYSNYNQHGAELVEKALGEHGIRTSRLSGDMNDSQKTQNVEDFKDGKSDVFISSPSGKEGISLPNVDEEIIFDPNWNPEVTRQAMGRGIRADSLADKVKVKKYLAVEPERKFLGIIPQKKRRSVEEWIHSNSEKKKKLQQDVYQYMGGNKPGRPSEKTGSAIGGYKEKNKEGSWSQKATSFSQKHNLPMNLSRAENAADAYKNYRGNPIDSAFRLGAGELGGQIGYQTTQKIVEPLKRQYYKLDNFQVPVLSELKTEHLDLIGEAAKGAGACQGAEEMRSAYQHISNAVRSLGDKYSKGSSSFRKSRSSKKTKSNNKTTSKPKKSFNYPPPNDVAKTTLSDVAKGTKLEGEFSELSPEEQLSRLREHNPSMADKVERLRKYNEKDVDGFEDYTTDYFFKTKSTLL